MIRVGHGLHACPRRSTHVKSWPRCEITVYAADRYVRRVKLPYGRSFDHQTQRAGRRDAVACPRASRHVWSEHHCAGFRSGRRRCNRRTWRDGSWRFRCTSRRANSHAYACFTRRGILRVAGDSDRNANDRRRIGDDWRCNERPFLHQRQRWNDQRKRIEEDACADALWPRSTS